MKKNDQRIYADIIREPVKKEDCEPLKEDMQKPKMKKDKEDDCACKESSTTHNDDFRRFAPARSPPIPRYHNLFLACVTLAIIMDIRL